MAECRISSLTDECNSNEDDDCVPRGKVGSVCKQWIVREDGVLAYRLQNEEISQHYEGNRCKNRIVREDVPLAKILQRNEEDEATAMRLQYDRIAQDQVESDERIAREIQYNLLKEVDSQRMIEEEDAKLASRLEKKERARLARKRLEREKQQVERAREQLNANSNKSYCDNNNEVTAISEYVDAVHLSDDTSSRVSDDLDDLSDFCMQPPSGLSGEELRIFIEQQDQELARFIQEQEVKRKSSCNREKLALIEAQDYEIARLLHRQEKERIKRIKERIKHRNMEKQLQNESISISDDNYLGQGKTPIVSENASYDDSIMYEEPYQIYHHNIAIDLDPTYKRQSKSCEPLPPPPSRTSQPPSDHENGIHFAQVYHVSPSSSHSPSPSSTATRTTNDAVLEDQYSPMVVSNPSLSPVPPYLPVQGQRRVSSIEKKTKKHKDACKTQ